MPQEQEHSGLKGDHSSAAALMACRTKIAELEQNQEELEARQTKLEQSIVTCIWMVMGPIMGAGLSTLAIWFIGKVGGH